MVTGAACHYHRLLQCRCAQCQQYSRYGVGCGHKGNLAAEDWCHQCQGFSVGADCVGMAEYGALHVNGLYVHLGFPVSHHFAAILDTFGYVVEAQWQSPRSRLAPVGDFHLCVRGAGRDIVDRK